MAGPQMPQKKKAKTDAKSKGEFNVEGINIPGEDDESVAVFDTCAEIRKKINAHLRIPGISKAGFLHEIAKTLPEPPTQGMSAKSLKTFLSQSMQMTSAGSPIYYAAYVLFEKLRIQQGKPKSKKREEMEEQWGMPGVRRISSQRTLGRADEHLYEDQYGRLLINETVLN